ncbi:MAG: hypothetical protein WC730_04235 [Patescibacteria group bacterium]|jgi:hypothetical protein
MLTFLLTTAIIFIVGPFLFIEGFAIWILIAFSRDDKLAKKVIQMATWWMIAGFAILILYFILRWLS